MIFRATYDDDGGIESVETLQFDIEMMWSDAQLHEGPHIKAAEKRVTVTASGYVATYDIVKQTKHETVARLRSVRRVDG